MKLTLNLDLLNVSFPSISVRRRDMEAGHQNRQAENTTEFSALHCFPNIGFKLFSFSVFQSLWNERDWEIICKKRKVK